MINRDISLYFLCESGIMKAVVKSRNFIGFLYIFLGFSLTSAGYISWLYHLMEVETTWDVDVISTVVAYLFQAVGIGIYTLFVRLKPGFVQRKIFVLPMYVLYVFFLAPAMFAESLTGTFLFGFIAQLICGMIAGGYLHSLAYLVDYGRRGIVFGAGYSVSSVAVWLISLIGNGYLLKSSFSLLIYAGLATALCAVAIYCAKQIYKDLPAEDGTSKSTVTEQDGIESSMPVAGGKLSKTAQSKRISIEILFVSAAAIFLVSLIKEMAFYFPAADIADGISLETSRLFYAAGLLLAGLIIDRNRKYGMISLLAATILPFVMLVLAREEVSRTVLWALDYFFYGFFAVYRIVLFSDMCKLDKEITGKIPYGAGILFGFGLLFGRLGDAAGTQIGITLGGKSVVLILLAGIAFVCIVLLFFRLYRYFYATGSMEVIAGTSGEEKENA